MIEIEIWVWTVVFAVIIDFAIGDPNLKIHPVMLIGKSISYLKTKLRKDKPGLDRFMGFLIFIIVSVIFCGFFLIIPYLFYVNLFSFNSYWEILVFSFLLGFLLKWSFAVRNLGDVVMPIYNGLVDGDLDKARKGLSWIVRRDTTNLSEKHVISATVEVIAESSTDATNSVFFFYVIGNIIGFFLFNLTGWGGFFFIGIPAAYMYRIINTGDSVVGYKDTEHRYIGWFLARADDVANYIPTRTTVFLMFVGAIFTKNLSMKDGWRVFRQEHNSLESVNAGWTMGTMAGLLQVQFEKVGKYKLNQSPIRELTPKDILTTKSFIRINMLMFIFTSIIILILITYYLGGVHN